MANFAKINVQRIESVFLDYELVPQADGIINDIPVQIIPKINDNTYPYSKEHLNMQIPITVKVIDGKIDINQINVISPNEWIIGLREHELENNLIIDINHNPNTIKTTKNPVNPALDIHQNKLVRYDKDKFKVWMFNGIPDQRFDFSVKNNLVLAQIIEHSSRYNHPFFDIEVEHIKAGNIFLTLQDYKNRKVIASHKERINRNITNPSKPIITENGAIISYGDTGRHNSTILYLTPDEIKKYTLTQDIKSNLQGTANLLYADYNAFLPMANRNVGKTVGSLNITDKFACTHINHINIKDGSYETIDLKLDNPHYMLFGSTTSNNDIFYFLNSDESYIVVKANKDRVEVYDHFNGPNTSNESFGDLLFKKSDLNKDKFIDSIMNKFESLFEDNSICQASHIGTENNMIYALLEPGFSDVYLGLAFSYNIERKQAEFFPFPKPGVGIPVKVSEYIVEFHINQLNNRFLKVPNNKSLSKKS